MKMPLYERAALSLLRGRTDRTVYWGECPPNLGHLVSSCKFLIEFEVVDAIFKAAPPVSPRIEDWVLPGDPTWLETQLTDSTRIGLLIERHSMLVAIGTANDTVRVGDQRRFEPDDGLTFRTLAAGLLLFLASSGTGTRETAKCNPYVARRAFPKQPDSVEYHSTCTRISLSEPPRPDHPSPTTVPSYWPRRLHYCRAHLRYRAGQLQTVRGHWRGDAGLGIVDKQYHVRP